MGCMMSKDGSLSKDKVILLITITLMVISRTELQLPFFFYSSENKYL